MHKKEIPGKINTLSGYFNDLRIATSRAAYTPDAPFQGADAESLVFLLGQSGDVQSHLGVKKNISALNA